MSKVSAIIPTLWKAKEFTDHLVNVLIKDKSVGEIILIDNAPTDFSYDNEKVVILRQEENLYVNPSWNLGVRHSNYDKFIIFNDDIIIPYRLVSKLEKLLTEKNGLIGVEMRARISIDKFDEENITRLDREINLKKVIHRPDWRVLVLGGHKNSYYYIPNELRIWHGDDFLFHMSEKNKLSTYVMDDIPIFTQLSTTSNLEEFDKIKEEDTENYINVCKEYGINE